MEIGGYSPDRTTVTIRIDRDGVEFILMALNELCNGEHFPASEFQTRIGFEREYGEGLMNLMADIKRELSPAKT
jgi:hypothetical protein